MYEFDENIISSNKILSFDNKLQENCTIRKPRRFIQHENFNTD